jgi:hypothetical protein
VHRINVRLGREVTTIVNSAQGSSAASGKSNLDAIKDAIWVQLIQGKKRWHSNQVILIITQRKCVGAPTHIVLQDYLTFQ